MRRLQSAKDPICMSRYVAGCGALTCGVVRRGHRATVWLLARVGPLVRGNGALAGELPGAH